MKEAGSVNDGAFVGGSTAASARGFSRPLNGEEMINKSLPLGSGEISAISGPQRIPRLHNLQPVRSSRANATGPISMRTDSINDNDSLQVAGKKQSEFIKKISSM